MARRALILASQTYGLQGCDADAELIRDVLGARGFACDVRVGADATRAGILDGFERLVGATGPGDAAVAYYSGHGGRIARPDAEARRATGRSAHFQFIVPYDIDDSQPDDFRGLLSEELTALQGRLTDAFTGRGATANVTLILDCCHSGFLARDPTLVPRYVELDARMFPLLGIRVRAEQVAADTGLRTNPHAVRLVACQEEQSAFERPSARGRRHGVLTDAFASLLTDVGDRPVSWTVVGDALRRTVQGAVPEQRPEVEGPTSTLLFSAEREPATGPTFPLDRRDGSLVIEAAAALGLATGDELALVDRAGREVARARVGAVVDGAAMLEPDPSGVDTTPEGSLRAVPRRLSSSRRIALEVSGDVGAALARRIDATSGLTTDTAAGAAIATIAADAGGLTVRDDADAPMLLAPEAADEAGQGRVVELLATMANGRRLRELASGADAAHLDADVDIRFDTVVAGVATARARHGERLAAGQAVALTVANLAAEPRFVWVFDVCLAGRVTLVTAAAPSGTLLAPHGEPGDVRSIWGADGTALFWPPDLPGGDPSSPAGLRAESLVVVVADRRQDLSSLAAPVASRGDDDLDAVLGAVDAGSRSAGEVFRYRVETIDFLVSP